MSRFLCMALLLSAAIPASGQSLDDLFNPHALHDIRIEMHPNDWQSLRDRFFENTFYPGDLHWRFDGTDVSMTQVAIRSRGTGSRSPVKPSLQLDFDRYSTSRKYLGLRALVLRNNAQDASMLHESLALAFIRRMGFAAPRTSYARLSVNGEYMGLYTVVEVIDEEFLRDRLGEDNGYLYQYDYDMTDPAYFFEYRGPNVANYSPKPFQPETQDADANAGHLEAMIRTINETADQDFESAMSSFLDLNALTTYLAVEAFLAESDGFVGDFGLNNFFLYRSRTSSQFRILPWDRSQSFTDAGRSIWTNLETNELTYRLLIRKSWQSEFMDAIEVAAATADAGEWLVQEISSQYAMIRQAVLEDMKKQCDFFRSGIISDCSNEHFEAAVQELFHFAQHRSAAVREEILAVVGAPTGGQKDYTVSSSLGAIFPTHGEFTGSLSGYAVIAPSNSESPPAAMAILQLRYGPIIVMEAPAAAAKPMTMGRIPVESGDGAVTGVSFVNTAPVGTQVNFFFTRQDGTAFGHGSLNLPANHQILGYLHDPPFSPGEAAASFTFSAQNPVAALAIRGITNERSEFLFAPVPVLDLAGSKGSGIVPLIVTGEQWETEVVLLNASDQPAAGAFTVRLTNQIVSHGYTIAPAGTFRMFLDPATSVQTGWLHVSPSAGPLPHSYAVLSLRQGGILATHAIVPAVEPSPVMRIYSEAAVGELEAGMVLVNPSDEPATVTLSLADLVTGQQFAVDPLTVPGRGQKAVLIRDLTGFTAPDNFQAILTITSPQAPLAAAGTRHRINARGDQIISIVPTLSAGSAGGNFFPLIVHSDEYRTQFVLYSDGRVQDQHGTLYFRKPDGSVLDLRLRR